MNNCIQNNQKFCITEPLVGIQHFNDAPLSIPNLSIIVDNILNKLNKNDAQPMQLNNKIESITFNVEECLKKIKNTDTFLGIILKTSYVVFGILAISIGVGSFAIGIIAAIVMIVGAAELFAIAPYAVVAPMFIIIIATAIILGTLSFIPAVIITLVSSLIAYQASKMKRDEQFEKMTQMKDIFENLQKWKEMCDSNKINDEEKQIFNEQHQKLIEEFNKGVSPIEKEMKSIFIQKMDLNEACDTAIKHINKELLKDNDQNEEHATLKEILTQLETIKKWNIADNFKFS